MSLLESPFIRVYYKKKELTSNFQDLSYKEKEEGDDECSFTVRTDDLKAPDLPEFQEDAELIVSWGYIGTTLIKNQKVIIRDISWDYDKENLTAHILATERGTSLKQNSSNKVYKNTSLLGVAKKLGDKHKLTTVVELPDDGDGSKAQQKSDPLVRLLTLGENIQIDSKTLSKHLPPVQTIVPEEISKMIAERSKQRREVDAISKKLYGATYGDIVDSRRDVPISDFNLLQIQNGILLKKFVDQSKTYPNVAQGNKTDMQLLNELAMKEPGGPYLAETHGDELIIRRRNFSQKPYKTYEYGSGAGELLSFKSDPKNRIKKGSSINTKFGHWDPITKTYYEGNANAINDSNKNVNVKWLEVYNNYKELAKTDPNLVIGTRDVITTFGAPVGAFPGAGDRTNLTTVIKVPITVTDKIALLEGKSLDQLDKEQANPSKANHDPSHDTPEDAYHHASNLRNNALLKSNPFSAVIIGDTGLRVGVLITIMGVSKKYSGNFYLAEVEHTIDKSGYTVKIAKMYRHGHNIKVNSNYIPYQEAGKNLNNSKGQSGNIPKTHTVGITTNKR